mmetsp:Transcript_12875/g.19952  ORF Transcript_12875/g.19952 Transcript_12875/m.19952 type:complete len:100 (+) Transcript_12875:909-1208(+)
MRVDPIRASRDARIAETGETLNGYANEGSKKEPVILQSTDQEVIFGKNNEPEAAAPKAEPKEPKSDFPDADKNEMVEEMGEVGKLGEPKKQVQKRKTGD